MSNERRNYTIKIARKRMEYATYHVVGATSKEEAIDRAQATAKFQDPPREEGDPLPHVYGMGTKPGVIFETMVVDLDSEPYKPCSCTECSKESPQ